MSLTAESLKENLNKCSKDELVDAILILVLSRKGLAIKALERQADEIINYLNEYSLVEKLDDKDDKTFDRGKMFLKDLPELEARIESLKLTHIPDKMQEDLKKKASSNSVHRFINGSP